MEKSLQKMGLIYVEAASSPLVYSDYCILIVS
jgi:hypothetical protein